LRTAAARTAAGRTASGVRPAPVRPLAANPRTSQQQARSALVAAAKARAAIAAQKAAEAAEAAEAAAAAAEGAPEEGGEEVEAEFDPEWEALGQEEGVEEDGAVLDEVNGEEGLEEPLPEEEAPVEDEAPVEEFPEEQEEFLEEPVEEPPSDKDDGAPRREDDLDLDQVDEDAKEAATAVEGQMRLKRLLSDDSLAQTKKQKMTASDLQLSALLGKWGLQADRSSRFVLETAESSDLEAAKKAMWRPDPMNPKTPAEQINEWLLKTRETNFPPGAMLDVIEAFRHRWKLTYKDVATLKTFNHKDLRFCLQSYDGIRSMEEIIEEAEFNTPDDEDKTCNASPEAPGLLTMGRFNRLELIEPFGDALVCGDANLTFSRCLATHRKSLGHSGKILATTFEKIDTLRERYLEIDQTVEFLQEHGAEVLHDVDATRLAVDPRFSGMKERFDAVYYNFPHAGVSPGFFDGHPFVRWRHENLMHLFFRALRYVVKPGGFVKVSSNSRARGVRYSDIIGAARNSEFVHFETVPFLEWTLRHYGRSYGDRRDVTRRPKDGENYNDQGGHSDMLYAFRYTPTGEELKPPSIRYPPTKEIMMASHEGNLANLVGPSKQRKVEEMHQLFLCYVQGIHVG